MSGAGRMNKFDSLSITQATRLVENPRFGRQGNLMNHSLSKIMSSEDMYHDQYAKNQMS